MKTVTGHGVIVLTLMYLALLIADQYNPTMNFINNPVTEGLLVLLCLFSVINAVFVLSRERARVRRREEKRRAAAPGKKPQMRRPHP